MIKTLKEKMETEAWAIISAHRAGRNHFQNRAASKLLMEMLHLSDRHDVYPAIGYWKGQKEASFLVFGISMSAAEALGLAFYQDCVIISDHYKPGNAFLSYADGHGHDYFSPSAEIKWGDDIPAETVGTEVVYRGERIRFAIQFEEED